MPTNHHLRNRILERLPEQDYRRIVRHMEQVRLPIGEIVSHPGVPPTWVHFPISTVLSSMVVLEDGSTIEGSIISNEGMDGLFVLTEPLTNPYKTLVQVEGEMLRVRAAAFKQFLKESVAMSQLLTRYALVLIQRGAQNAACIQHHTIEERMCRWLLETARRHGQDKFHLTQEYLGHLLGVRRQSVNLTARLLQQANLIRYHRGELTILDRPGLEETSCECFQVISEMYEHSMRLPDECLLQMHSPLPDKPWGTAHNKRCQDRR